MNDLEAYERAVREAPDRPRLPRIDGELTTAAKEEVAAVAESAVAQAVEEAPPPDDIYLVWSNEHMGWWKPGGYGYASIHADAGHFTRKQAITICRGAMPGNPGALSEIPVRLVDLNEFVA